jgi:putative multicomponent Na+:H+ antiporter subunit B
MGEDIYIMAIVALLPLSALILTFQVNPYHALILRGILGAVAALVYAVLGGADVALTEALVGTMLGITLYAVAVRSSLVMRLGVLKSEWSDAEVVKPEEEEPALLSTVLPPYRHQLLQDFRAVLKKHYMRLELLSFENEQSLTQALSDREVHAICTHRSSCRLVPDAEISENTQPETASYHTIIRVRRLYDLLQAELASPLTHLSYFNHEEISEPRFTLPLSPSTVVVPTGEELP